jgi:hypothetical protein
VIEGRIIEETDEISLYALLGLAMREGLDLREVVVSYAGCGSHNVLVSALERETDDAPRRLVPVDDDLGDEDLGPLKPGELTPSGYGGFDTEVGF